MSKSAAADAAHKRDRAKRAERKIADIAQPAAPLTFVSYVAALLAAGLLFAVEPMFVKMALPSLGGSPMVWNVAFVFFTAMLVAGYLYAHWLSRFDIRRQLIAHTVVLVLAAVDVPIRIPASWHADAGAPSIWLFELLALRVGLPFFALAATSPLLQTWLAYADESGRGNPYVLYAASNLGSFAALLAYPVAVEPFFGLALQSEVWSFGYAAFVVLLVVSGTLAVRARPARTEPVQSRTSALLSSEIDNRQRITWVVLAAVPASLVLGMTTHLSTEIGTIPVLWTFPLAVYLLTFVAAFSDRAFFRAARVARVVPFVLLPLVVLLATHAKLTIAAYVGLQLLVLFCVALTLHARLAESRPAPKFLTEFYLWLALGGAVGSALTVLVAPLIVPDVGEYPLALVLACLLLPTGALIRSDGRTAAGDVGRPLLLVAAALLLLKFASVDSSEETSRSFWLSLAAGMSLVFYARRLSFATAVAALLLAGALLPDLSGVVLARERNFFGTKRVSLDPSGGYTVLTYGATIHGAQSRDPARSKEPLTYYARSGPLGDIFGAIGQRLQNRKVAVVGLGIGSTACYKTPAQEWTYFEIDPAIVGIARNPNYFSMLSSCAPDARIVEGDARVSLERAAPESFELIILDAYNGDQVPLHLLTREALAIYLRALAPDGILAFHISNRYFNFSPVLDALAQNGDLAALERDDTDEQPGKSPSSWVIMARRGFLPQVLANDAKWKSLTRDAELPLWTDDYSSLVRIWRP